jgi:gliding motility-associated-like protein
VTCAGADNGTATLTVNGGSLPYTFLWSDFRGVQNRDSLHAGWYFVIITDGYGCQKRDSVKILTPLPLVLSDTIVPVSCTNGSNGSIHIITSGGTGAPGTFTYTWTPSGPNSPDNTNLSAGTYSVIVSDSNRCTATLSVQLANPAPLTSTYGVTEPRCNGERSGAINLVVGGGTPQYSYAWTPAGPNSPYYTNILAGTYRVTVTDSRGCTLSDTIVVNEPGAMYISGIQKNVSCHGNSDGYLLPTGYGGTQPYSYQWYLGTDTFAPQGPITENITQLAGGDYYLVITDAHGCMAPFTRHIIEPDSLIVTLSDSNVTCYGSSTGSVLASVRGGTAPYQYLWNNFTTDSVQRGVPAGTYTVVVTDSNGCHQNKAITVTQSPILAVTVTSSTDPSCASGNNGSISVSAAGGRPTYTYSWNTTPVQNTPTASNLAAGSYTVTVTDLNGCSQTETVVLTAPAPLEVNTAISNPTCAGGDNGFVSLDVRGGTAPYLYNWSTTPAQAGNVASALSGGTYYATVTDAHGCLLLDTAVVVSPQPIVVTIGVNSSTCPGNNVGLVVVTATGGLAPYNYALGSVTQASDTFRNLGVGTYSVVVTDVNGCQGDAPLTVGAVGVFTDTLTASPNVILAGEVVHLYARASSDTTITSYIWYPADSLDFSSCASSSDCNNPTVRPTQTQDYIVTVVNARGCTISDTVHVSVSNQPSAFIPLAFTPNGDGLNDKFEFDILGATTVNVQIWNRWGELVYSNPSQANGIDNTSGWDGQFRGQMAAYDTYTYQFDVTYFDGHHETKAGTVTIIR